MSHFLPTKLQHRIATKFVSRLTCTGVRTQSCAVVQWRLLWSYSDVTCHVSNHYRHGCSFCEDCSVWQNSVRSEAQVKSIWACVTRPQRYHFFLGLVQGLRCHSSTRLKWIGIQYPKLIASDASLQTPKEKQIIHQWLHYTIQSLNSCKSPYRSIRYRIFPQ